MNPREHYQAFMEKQLNEWKAQTERFKDGAERLEAQARAQYEKNLEQLRAKQEEAWENFHKMQTASEDAWVQFKANMDKAASQVKDAAERMSEHIQKR
jgi:hypothetical protein